MHQSNRSDINYAEAIKSIQNIYLGKLDNVHSLRGLANFLPYGMREGQQDAHQFMNMILQQYLTEEFEENFLFTETSFYYCTLCEKVISALLIVSYACLIVVQCPVCQHYFGCLHK